jgi:hypothetical protein
MVPQPRLPDDTVNLLRDPDDETPRSVEYVRYRDWILEKSIDDGPDENGRWRRYIAALEDAWAECYDAAEDRAVAIEDLTTEVENLRAAAGGEDEADRAAREALTARQEVAELRRQLVEAEEAVRASEVAVRMVLAASARNPRRAGSATNTFTIDPKRLPVFKGERDMQVVGDFINDLQRQFEARCHDIGWLETMTPAGSGPQHQPWEQPKRQPRERTDGLGMPYSSSRRLRAGGQLRHFRPASHTRPGTTSARG